MVEEVVGAGCWSTDLITGIGHWSAGMYRLLGIEPGSVTPSHQLFREFIHPDDRRNLRNDWPQWALDGLSWNNEFRVIRTNGAVRWLASKAEVVRRDEAGRSVRAAGVLIDITARKEDQRGRRLVRDRYVALSRTLSSIVWVTGPDGMATGSEHWMELTGQSMEDMVGLGWVAALHPADQDRVLHAWREALHRTWQYDIDYRIRCADGHYHWFNARGAPVYCENGTLREWIGISRPIEAGRPPRSLASDHHHRVVSRPPRRSIDGSLMRAARALQNWSVPDLAEAAQVSVSTIRRIEDNDAPVRPRAQNLAALQQALEAAGVEFLWATDGSPSIRLAAWANAAAAERRPVAAGPRASGGGPAARPGVASS